MQEVLSTPEAGETTSDQVLNVLGITVVDRLVPFGVTEAEAIDAANPNSMRSDTAGG